MIEYRKYIALRGMYALINSGIICLDIKNYNGKMILNSPQRDDFEEISEFEFIWYGFKFVRDFCLLLVHIIWG